MRDQGCSRDHGQVSVTGSEGERGVAYVMNTSHGVLSAKSRRLGNGEPLEGFKQKI